MGMEVAGKESKKVHKIEVRAVREALLAQVHVVAAHLDLEGISYIKLTRTGADICFSADHTSKVLKLEGMDHAEQSKVFWKKPAMEKWGESS
jgi:hypothetical protein